MSVEENKALVRRLYEEALNKGNLAIVDEILAPNYVRQGLAPGTPPGPESTKQVFATMRSAPPTSASLLRTWSTKGPRSWPA
jgi:predicted SnoaL-like aldol condensation-catalyzing enzyme